jgi:hypothetical protein
VVIAINDLGVEVEDNPNWIMSANQPFCGADLKREQINLVDHILSVPTTIVNLGAKAETVCK